ACSLKFVEGGWFPLTVGLLLFTAMTTWKRGWALVRTAGPQPPSLLPTAARLDADPDLPRCARTAVFPTGDPATVPRALMHNVMHNRVLHERNVILTVRYEDVPHVAGDERLRVASLGGSFWQVEASYGFMEQPNVPEALADCRPLGLDLPP